MTPEDAKAQVQAFAAVLVAELRSWEPSETDYDAIELLQRLHQLDVPDEVYVSAVKAMFVERAA